MPRGGSPKFKSKMRGFETKQPQHLIKRYEMFGKTKFEKLFEPGQIGRVKTKNRIVKPAQSMHYAEDDGGITDRNLGFYEAIAKGGGGLIVVEMAAVDYPIGYPSLKDLRVDDDRFIPGLSELAKLIHSYDVATFLQITHSGPSHSPIEGTQPRGPSSLSLDELPRTTYGPTIGVAIPEIEDIVEKFAKGAERAQKAGFDGVEIHGAHGYLIASFFSGAWNRRQDLYGGSLENRARFACEVIRAIRKRVGRDFAVGIRVNGAEYGVKNGTTPEEAQVMCQMLEESGADCIDISAFGYGTSYSLVIYPEQIFYPEGPRPLGEGFDGSRKGAGGISLLAAGIKKVVSIPVIAVGRLDPFLSEKILRQGAADFVCLGRCQLADPEIVRKVREGREQDVVPCTADLACIDAYVRGRPVVCRVNAAIGKEREYAIKPAEKKKRVMIIGGGPAGMEAARVAALRGHEVMLYEKGYKLGGAMLIAALVKGLDIEDLVALTSYFRVQIKKLGVKVRFGKEVDDALIKEIKPDVVILGTGGIAAVPGIPGIDRRIVANQSRFYQRINTYLRFFGPKVLRWLTKFYLPVGEKVVIIGGGIQGIQLAEFLVKRGRKVTVTETSDELGAEMATANAARVLHWLAKKGCTLQSGIKYYEEITDKGLTLVIKEGERQTIEADTILPALPLRPNTELFESLKGKVPEIYLIGDAREPHLILEAIGEGFRTALTI